MRDRGHLRWPRVGTAQRPMSVHPPASVTIQVRKTNRCHLPRAATRPREEETQEKINGLTQTNLIMRLKHLNERVS